jgi:hypothetical protein
MCIPIIDSPPASLKGHLGRPGRLFEVLETVLIEPLAVA